MKEEKQNLIQDKDNVEIDEDNQLFKKSIRIFKKKVTYADHNILLKNLKIYLLYPLAYGIVVYIVAWLILKNKNLNYLQERQQRLENLNNQNMNDLYNDYNYSDDDFNNFHNYDNLNENIDNKTKIYVNKVDMWAYFYWFEFDIYKILKKKYKIIISDNPQFLFYSSYGNENKNYNCTKIYLSNNKELPNFNECDYAIGYQFLNNTENRYIQKPIDVDYFNNMENIYNIVIENYINTTEKKFCCIMEIYYSDMVKNFSAKLSEYKNIEEYKIDMMDSELEFLEKYKFAILDAKNYEKNVEKFNQIFKAGTIPIFLGEDPFLETYNNKSFIWIKNETEFDQKINYIKEIDKNEKLYNETINEKIVLKKTEYDKEITKYNEFIYNIIEKHLYDYNKSDEVNEYDSEGDVD